MTNNYNQYFARVLQRNDYPRAAEESELGSRRPQEFSEQWPKFDRPFDASYTQPNRGIRCFNSVNDYRNRDMNISNPQQLKVGDRVRFVAMPDEWNVKSRCVPRDSRAFMKHMIQRKYPSRISRIDESGYPWIAARIKQRGKIHYHYWLITEASGWRLVRRRRTKRTKRTN